MGGTYGFSIIVVNNLLIAFFTNSEKILIYIGECAIITKLKGSLKFLWSVYSSKKGSWFGSLKVFRKDSISILL